MNVEERLARVETEIKGLHEVVDTRFAAIAEATSIERGNRVLRDEKQNEFRGALSDLSLNKIDRKEAIGLFDRAVERIEGIEKRLVEKIEAGEDRLAEKFDDVRDRLTAYEKATAEAGGAQTGKDQVLKLIFGSAAAALAILTVLLLFAK